MKYIGYWRAGNSENIDGREDNNINRLRRHLRWCARHNGFVGDSASYQIFWQDGKRSMREDGWLDRGCWVVETEQEIY